MNLNNYTDVVFLNDTHREICFWVNDRYGKIGRICRRGISLPEWDNLQKEPIQEDITNNSSELLQIVKELKS